MTNAKTTARRKADGVVGAAEPVAKRGKGRPKLTGDPVGAEEIVACACELLRSMPLQKVTAAVVAQRAGVNPTLVNYYFKGRSELMVAAVVQLLRGVRVTDEFCNPNLSTEERLRSRVVKLIEFYDEHPYFGRLARNEILQIENPTVYTSLLDLVLGDVARHEEFLQLATREAVRHVDPAFFFISIVGMCEFYHLNSHLLERRFGADMDRNSARDHYVDYVVHLILDGLRSRDPRGPAHEPG